MTQKLRRNADTGVGDDDRRVSVVVGELTVIIPPGSVNLTAFESRFQVTC